MKFLLQTPTARAILMALFAIIVVRVCSYDSYEGAGYQEPDEEYWGVGGKP
ncbi:MAG: hypothetical protein AAGA74_21080 [Pseudomonadota bacterium]